MTFTGTVALPSLVFGPFRVAATNSIVGKVCNPTTSSVSVTSIGVRFVTFG